MCSYGDIAIILLLTTNSYLSGYQFFGENRRNLEHFAKLLTDKIFSPANQLTDENI